jgi:hypothetical protein
MDNYQPTGKFEIITLGTNRIRILTVPNCENWVSQLKISGLKH